MFNLTHLSRGTLIRIDDIAENMNWEMMRKCERLFLKYNIKPLLGVIPNNKDPEFLKYPKDNNFWFKIKKWQELGWEISMHGYSHMYETETKGKDYFMLGGKSEFFGKSLNEQIRIIKSGLRIFKEKEVIIKSFFAPNHTYDANTFKALKICGINVVVDGYGFQPYYKNDLIFIPQLFYRLISLPFAFQTTQVHLNEWSESDYSNFENFVIKYNKKIISYKEILNHVSDNFFSNMINYLLKKSIITLRKVRRI